MSLADKLTTIAENMPKVYEAGKSEHRNNTWNAIQQYGNRKAYVSYFSYWKTDAFYPKYDFILTGANNGMFNAFGRYNDGTKDCVDTPINLIERLNECGVVLDTSGVTNGNYMFQYACVTHLPTINLTSLTNRTGLFAASSLLYIEKVILSEDGTNLSGAFGSTARALTHMMVEGKIINNFDIKASPLDVESAKSILVALNDYSGTSEEGTYNVYFAESVWGLLDAEGETSPNGTTWKEYVDAKGYGY